MAYTPAGVEVEVRVLANRLTGALQSQLRSAAKAAVRKNLMAIQQDWGAHVRVDTEALKKSILDPKAIVIEANGLEGTVGTDNDHAEVNEYGGPTISAQADARQAGAKAKPEFEAEMKRITKELER